MIPPALASFRLATTCEFMVDIEATPGTPHYYHGLPSAPRSRETLSSNPNAHVYATFRPRRVIFQPDFVLRCRSCKGHDQASKISSALAVSICSEKRE